MSGLFIGVRGSFASRARLDANGLLSVDDVLRNALSAWRRENRPWQTCDAGGDLSTKGAGVLRGWLHVALRQTDERAAYGVTEIAAMVASRIALLGTLQVHGVETRADPISGSTLTLQEDLLVERFVLERVQDEFDELVRASRVVVFRQDGGALMADAVEELERALKQYLPAVLLESGLREGVTRREPLDWSSHRTVYQVRSALKVRDIASAGLITESVIRAWGDSGLTERVGVSCTWSSAGQLDPS